MWKANYAVRVTDYFQNGSKKLERVRDGKQEIISEFDDDGRLSEREVLVDRERHGLHERFLPDGGALLRESYVEGDLQGRRQSWFENGKPEEDSQWEKGHVTARKRWEPDGGLVEDEEFYEDGSRKKKR